MITCNPRDDCYNIGWALCAYETMNSDIVRAILSMKEIFLQCWKAYPLDTFELILQDNHARMVRTQHVKLRTIGIQCRNGRRHWMLSLRPKIADSSCRV